MLTYDDLPTDVQAKLDVADRACEMRRYREAVPVLSEVVDAYPSYVNGVFTLGRALRAIGERDQANARFVAAATIAPDDPRICLGCAWARLDADDFPAAAELAARALPGAATNLRGEFLAVLGLAAEHQGRGHDAARLYLEAYEAGTRLDWLEAHCRLVGVEYLVDKHGARAPWPIGTAQRRWMYAAIGNALASTGREKQPDVPDLKFLVNGCDRTAQMTARWAARAGIDRARLYQALADRGGFCDCEVLLNAASEDDEVRGLALVVGAIGGDLEHGMAPLQSWLSEDSPGQAPTLEPDAEVPEDSVGIFVDGAEIPLQITDSATLGEILCNAAEAPPPDAFVQLLVGFLGEPVTLVTAGPDGLRFRELGEAASAAALDEAWPGAAAALVALRAGLQSQPSAW